VLRTFCKSAFLLDLVWLFWGCQIFTDGFSGVLIESSCFLFCFELKDWLLFLKFRFLLKSSPLLYLIEIHSLANQTCYTLLLKVQKNASYTSPGIFFLLIKELGKRQVGVNIIFWLGFCWKRIYVNNN